MTPPIPSVPAPRAFLASTALAVALLAGCAEPAAPPAFVPPPAAVRVTPAVAREVPVYLDEIGRVLASESVSIRPQVTGKITEVLFEEGADIRKGDVLVRIDPRPFQARLDAAQAAVQRGQAELARARTATLRPTAARERAVAALDLAKLEFERAEGLLGTKAIARADYDAKKGAVAVCEAEVRQAEAEIRAAEPEVAQAEAALKQAEADVATAAIDLDYCTIRSPIDGRAGRRLADAGNVVSANGAAILDLHRIDKVYVEFSIAEKHILDVQRSQAAGALRAEVRLPVAAGTTAAARDAALSGTLTYMDSAVDAGTGTLRLRATLDNAGRKLWPGRFVEVRLVLSRIADAVLVPAGADQVSPTGPFLYVVSAEGTAEMRPVVLGQRQGDLVVVQQGIRAGERVIVQGQFAVAPGGKVRVVDEAEHAAPAGTKDGSR